MIPVQTPLTEAEKKFLETQLQLKPKSVDPLPAWKNPHNWTLNGILLLGSIGGRFWASRARSPTVVWSCAIVAIPAFALMSTVKLDSLAYKFGHRKTLEERLDLSPVTRRAWERAVKSNGEYQEDLKRQIHKLKTQTPGQQSHDE